MYVGVLTLRASRCGLHALRAIRVMMSMNYSQKTRGYCLWCFWLLVGIRTALWVGRHAFENTAQNGLAQCVWRPSLFVDVVNGFKRF